MKVVKCVFAGKTYELPANNSGWISDSETKIPDALVKLLRERPRVGKGSKGEPIIQDDLGKRISLGSASLRLEGETIGGTGSGGSKCPRMFALEALKFKDKLSKEAIAFFEEAARDPKLDKMVHDLMAMGKTEAEAKKFLGI